MNIPDQVRSFLKNNSLASVATFPANGHYPHISPVFYLFDNRMQIDFISVKQSAKIADIQKNNYVAVSVTSVSGLKTIELQCEAKIVTDLGSEEHDIVEEINRISQLQSESTFAPVMKLDHGNINLVTLTVVSYKFADYAGREAKLLSGTFS